MHKTQNKKKKVVIVVTQYLSDLGGLKIKSVSESDQSTIEHKTGTGNKGSWGMEIKSSSIIALNTCYLIEYSEKTNLSKICSKTDLR